MKKNPLAITTHAVAVEISLLDGATVSGKLNIPLQIRLIDVLNDDRQFLPIDRGGSGFVALAKSAIKQISLPAVEETADDDDDPWLILGVRKGASQEELKKAWHQLRDTNHPDRIKSLGLGADHQELAAQNIVRIDAAYAQILKEAG